jgi:phosphate transport system protein
MRERFADHLAEIEQQIEAALRDAVGTLSLVAEAVVEPSGGAIGAVIAAAVRVRDSSRSGDAALVIVSAREAPVAEDLRLVMTLIQLAQHQALIANQFELISEQLASIQPGVADRQGTARRLARMATLAGSQLQNAVGAFASRELAAAYQVESDDDAIDQLNVEIFKVTLDLEGSSSQRERAYRHVLIARSLERIGDNAVDIAEQAAFLETRQLREFTDASTPRKRRDPSC